LRGAPEPARIGRIRIGTASWTERTLLESGAFYPSGIHTAEQRLRYYARHFPLVEVDSSYYALPSVRNTEAWVERTPSDFLFGVKAYAALTHHPIEPRRLDRDLQGELPPAIAAKPRVYPDDVPSTLVDAIWERFCAALTPIERAGKLGYVLFQMPPWFRATAESRAYLEEIVARARGLPLAVEFREPLWMAETQRDRTLDFLRRHGLAYVSVDEPQHTRSSVPPIATATSDTVAVVRFHGRRRETWTARGVGTTERFRYLYQPDELREWVPRLHALARTTREVLVVMNNCYRQYGVQNAKDLAGLLAAEA
jgi:uncharacterized protein YecE (DUF72 family)